ncbi:MAG: RsmB/NOP family class I SAM-dependent RNA methyltransferase [Candidatus Omnitrophica bacterium]|nr:RsmB/NOP family class I SAM-dependent RNA methyltransferase [Candidatus Omnitrophota bacterium]
MNLPVKFIERLKQIIPPENYADVLETFSLPRKAWMRINRLKSNIASVREILDAENIKYEQNPIFEFALLIDQLAKDAEIINDLISKGILYPQNISSMLPALILNPQAGENILDTCAAPGSKTSQMAEMMQNKGNIQAIEAIPKRLFKLRSIMQLLGVEIVDSCCCDARKFNANDQLFDKILVDAPCSSEGRFSTNDPKTIGYWSPRKIKEMMQKQRGILLSASRLLKTGGTLIYSTCTFAPEENEGIIDWFLRKCDPSIKMESINLPNNIKTYPAITSWGKKLYSHEVAKSIRILPNGIYEAFFMAMFKKF